jgi:hypothetical protein
LFGAIATAWVTAYPQSPEALEARAVALEMLEDPAGLDTLRLARQLEPAEQERARLATAVVWLQLKFSVPTDLEGVWTARALADSLLAGPPPTTAAEARRRSALAALTGRAHLAARLARRAASDWGAAGSIALLGPPLVAYAVMGGPRDTLLVLERDLVAKIATLSDASERQGARMSWLARAAQLSFPHVPLQSTPGLAGLGNPLIDAQAAYLRGDRAAVGRILAGIRDVQRQFAPSEITLDFLYPAARLLSTIDVPQASAWLSPTLNALQSTPPGMFNDPARAGAFVQAMVLQAELADRIGDRESAARWARVVLVLWSDADEFVRPIVANMARLGH